MATGRRDPEAAAAAATLDGRRASSTAGRCGSDRAPAATARREPLAAVPDGLGSVGSRPRVGPSIAISSCRPVDPPGAPHRLAADRRLEPRSAGRSSISFLAVGRIKHALRSVAFGQRQGHRQHARGRRAARAHRARRRRRLQGRAVQHRRHRARSWSAASSAALVGAAVAQQPAPIAVTVALLAGALGGALYGLHPGRPQGVHRAPTRSSRRSCSTRWRAFVIVGLVNDVFKIAGPSFARTADVGNAALPILFGRERQHRHPHRPRGRPDRRASCSGGPRSASRSGPSAPTRVPLATRG